MAITPEEVLGWLGSLSYIIAYLLLSMKKLTADNSIYHLLNILGAIGLIVNALHWKDFPSVVVNLVWFVIGLIAILMIIRKKRDHAGSAV